MAENTILINSILEASKKLTNIEKMFKRLPYDAEVEYVESTGTQYVDTGFVPDGNTNAEISALYNWASSVVYTLFGAGDGWHNNEFGVCVNTGSESGMGAILYEKGGNADRRYIGAVNLAGTFVKSEIIGTNCYANGTLLTSGVGTITGLLSTTNSVFIGAHHRIGSIGEYLVGKVAYCKFWQSGVLVRDFIPVRVGQIGYLYDRANPTGGPHSNGLYGSATGTPLVAGPDKLINSI